MELVEKNILPVESSLKEALIGEEAQTPCALAGQMQRTRVGSGLLALELLALTWGTEVQSARA